MRGARPWLLGLLVVLALVAAFVSGRVSVGVPQAATPAAVPPPTAPVAKGAVTQTADIPLSLTTTWSVDIAPPLEAPRLVVNRMAPKPGQKMAACTSPVSVNDVPVVLLPASAPFFRDLAAGAKGSDVAALQRALEWCGHRVKDNAGGFGTTTSAAWAALLRPYTTAPASTVGWRQIVQIPDGVTDVRVATVSASAGQVVQPGAPLLRLTAGAPVAVGGADPAVARALGVGRRLPVTLASGARTTATVTALTPPAASTGTAGTPGAAPTPAPSDGDASAADGTRVEPERIAPGQYRVQLTLPAGTPAGDRPLSASVPLGSSPAGALNVPLSALTTCGGAACVRVHQNGGDQEVKVRTGLSDGRIVAVVPQGGALAPGDAVMVTAS